MNQRFPISLSLAPLLLLAGLLLLCACGGEGKKQLVVAFSQANNAEPYRAAQNAFMTKLFAQDADVKLVISDAQQDNSKQVAQVETFIRQKPELAQKGIAAVLVAIGVVLVSR